MKRYAVVLSIVMGLVVAAGAVAAGSSDVAATGRGRGPQGGGRYGAQNQTAGETEDIGAIVAGLPAEDLSDAEAEGLLFMWEEEKLARDVYRALYGVWNLPIFSNISDSEQQHMDALGELLDRYDLTRPSGEEAGVFASPTLAGLYDSLVAQGSESLTAALQVGATIEDLDIADLQEYVAISDSDDVRIVYQNLMKGSRNHLRSFVAQLQRAGESYQAQYISDEYLARILEIVRETAPILEADYAL